MPSAHPMPAGPRRTCPPRHTWEPAVVGLSGPGLSWGYLKTCCQPVLDRSGAPGRPAPSRGDVGTEARVWEQFILAPYEDLKITPPPSPLGLGRCIRYQYSSRLRPSPSSCGLPYSWTCRVFLVQMEKQAWKDKVNWPRSRSGNSQDCALSSTPRSCLSLSVRVREIRGTQTGRLGPCLSALSRAVGCAVGGWKVAEVSLWGGWKPLGAVSAAWVCARVRV